MCQNFNRVSAGKEHRLFYEANCISASTSSIDISKFYQNATQPAVVLFLMVQGILEMGAGDIALFA